MTAKSIAKELIACFKRGNKLMICGNGGSAAEAQHFAAELVGNFEQKRQALSAIALTTDTSILTAIANDFNFTYIFTRQVEALGKEDDILILLSTSGKSHNVISAKVTAEERGLKVIDFPRKGNSTAKIQEYQLKLIHDVCRITEKAFERILP